MKAFRGHREPLGGQGQGGVRVRVKQLNAAQRLVLQGVDQGPGLAGAPMKVAQGAQVAQVIGALGDRPLPGHARARQAPMAAGEGCPSAPRSAAIAASTSL